MVGKSWFVALVVCLSVLQGQTQTISISWDARFGGSKGDYLTNFIQTQDGGFILGGYSWSDADGNKTELNWDPTLLTADFWIVKVDPFGVEQWNKRFGGDAFEGPFFDIKQTSDGGFIVGGTSYSGLSGDKTQVGFGSADCWILKLDNAGNVQWDKTFGGTNADGLAMLQQTTDGGFILGCYSQSGISGTKTQPGWGLMDYWIVRLDATGNYLWDKDFGGDQDDLLTSIQQTSDGGFVLAGYSYSDATGNKSEPNWDASLLTCDYWIVKTDALGGVIWNKRFGGDSWESGVNQNRVDVRETSDGGFIIGGISFSGATGDKSDPTIDILPIKSDYWIVKTDFLGNILWDKKYGGTYPEDHFGYITETTDGGFLISGTSYSFASGDKSQNNLSNEQSWIVKTDRLGFKQWDRTLLTSSNGDDEIGLAIQTAEGCYAAANFTPAGSGGDKSQGGQGDYDYWMVYFCDSTDRLINFPNVFTPNGDGINDELFFDNSDLVIFTVKIYDRWGVNIFTSSPTILNWDGRNSFGKECADGTYYILVEGINSQNQSVTKTGIITLVR